MAAAFTVLHACASTHGEPTPPRCSVQELTWPTASAASLLGVHSDGDVLLDTGAGVVAWDLHDAATQAWSRPGPRALPIVIDGSLFQISLQCPDGCDTSACCTPTTFALGLVAADGTVPHPVAVATFPGAFVALATFPLARATVLSASTTLTDGEQFVVVDDMGAAFPSATPVDASGPVLCATGSADAPITLVATAASHVALVWWSATSGSLEVERVVDLGSRPIVLPSAIAGFVVSTADVVVVAIPAADTPRHHDVVVIGRADGVERARMSVEGLATSLVVGADVVIETSLVRVGTSDNAFVRALQIEPLSLAWEALLEPNVPSSEGLPDSIGLTTDQFLVSGPAPASVRLVDCRFSSP